jgi:hypothetical protein
MNVNAKPIDSKGRARTGLLALKARVMVKGLSVVDRRSVAARNLLAWRDELTAALGGSDAISPQQKALVELCARTRLILDHADAFVLQQGNLINKRRRALYPIVEQRQRLSDSLLKSLQALGLERRGKPVQDLHEYLLEKAAEMQAEGAKAAEPEGDHG